MIDNKETIFRLLTSQNTDDRKIGTELLERQNCPDDIKDNLYFKADAELMNKYGIYVWRMRRESGTINAIEIR